MNRQIGPYGLNLTRKHTESGIEITLYAYKRGVWWRSWCATYIDHGRTMP